MNEILENNFEKCDKVLSITHHQEQGGKAWQSHLSPVRTAIMRNDKITGAVTDMGKRIPYCEGVIIKRIIMKSSAKFPQ